ncbi:hypothetical protein NDU88_003433 [Pleurodeles waltl]|uniref:Uncharacterized protein n=1 Tax=Pleurodeles waltl TaxID=8319 RepID=A0AAV7V2F9_PLEWA|nr:hypothetical protein NDU88_003433 [Pleurodeles waltl]
MGSSGYRSGDSSRFLTGCRLWQSVAGTGHMCLIHGPCVIRAWPLWLRRRQPGRLRPQSGPVTDGSPPPIQAPSRSRSRQRASLLEVLWHTEVPSALSSAWFKS